MSFITTNLLIFFLCGVCSESDVQYSEFEASLKKIDDTKLMLPYGSEGSAINLKLSIVKLTNSNIALIISNKGLVSNVSSVSGATSISGDPDGFGFSIGFSGDYLFEFDRDRLTSEAKASLETVIVLYEEYDGKNILVEGHTDAKGSNAYNQSLSERRAISVKNWFALAGIQQSLIKTKGYGESKPVASNTKNGKDDPEGRSQNRRVEIKVRTKKKVNHLPVVSKPRPLN